MSRYCSYNIAYFAIYQVSKLSKNEFHFFGIDLEWFKKSSEKLILKTVCTLAMGHSYFMTEKIENGQTKYKNDQKYQFSRKF